MVEVRLIFNLKINNMKNIKLLSLILLTMFLISSCDKEQDDLVTKNANEGGLIEVASKSLNYVVGDGGTYSFKMLVHQNSSFDVSKVYIYKSFKGVKGNSNEVLAESIDATGADFITLTSKDYSYEELISGLTISESPLPTSDSELSIGDKFAFRLVSELTDGSKFEQSYTVNMTVSTRFAGTYLVTAGDYFRIGAHNGIDFWVGGTAQIESVDAKTYRYAEWGALSGWGGNVLYFQVEDDGTITYPAEWDGVAQTLNGQPLITCALNGPDLSNVQCEGSNVVIKDDVNGKDQLKMTYGYFTGGSGPREFQFNLVKK